MLHMEQFDDRPASSNETDLISDDTVEAAVSGAKVALRQIVQAVAPQLTLMVAARVNLTPDRFHVIDEITQQSLVALVGGITRLNRPTAIGLKCYLSMIVAHKVADYLRRRKQSGHEDFTFDTSTTTTTDDVIGEAMMATDTTPGRAAERAEQIQQLMQKLSLLRPNYREVIVLAVYDQLSTVEIAERLGITRPAASMLLKRALDALRELVQPDSRAQHDAAS